MKDYHKELYSWQEDIGILEIIGIFLLLIKNAFLGKGEG